MKFDIGIAITGVAMFLFYLRLAMLRGRKRRERREEELKIMRSGKKVKFTENDPSKPFYQVSSWWLVGIGAALMLFGVISRTTPTLPPILFQYWWVSTSIGVLVLAASLK